MKGLVSTLVLVALATACQQVAFSTKSSQAPGPTNNTISPLLCAAGNPTGPNVQYYPTSCLLPQGFPANTLGVQINNAYKLTNKVFEVSANLPTGTSQDTLTYIEISTYVYPDTVVIRSIKNDGSATDILNICNISTYDVADPTDGTYRPYSSTILQFLVVIPKGTKKLQFDYTNSKSPTYVGFYNLGDFSQSLLNPSTNPFYGTSRVNYFRPQNGMPNPYNDNSDPRHSQPMCPNQ